MKAVTLVVLAVGYVSALGSGPYLPSGWRPQGPAFLLPSEVKKTSPILKHAPAHESEASGSDFLQEYGPPKVQEVSQDITQQGLPDVDIEQPFFEIDSRFYKEIEENNGITKKVTSELRSALEEIVTATESQTTNEEKTTTVVEAKPLALVQSTDLQAKAVIEETSQAIQEESTETAEVIQTENANSNIVSSVKQREEKVEEQVRTGKDRVHNIAETLYNLENEYKDQQAKAIQDVAEVKTVQERSGFIAAPEGFVEYGPPGFKEYGPPKQEALLRSGLVVEEKSSDTALETNDTRKRRFSSKFISSLRRKF